tara:strand:+ start:346 stop:558 length:213 start_codon:yes stop_codon:yes gene_type:complete
MKVKKLIKELNKCDPQAEIVFYYNENHELHSCELACKNDCWPHAPLLEFEKHVELIIKPEGSEEGGVETD